MENINIFLGFTDDKKQEEEKRELEKRINSAMKSISDTEMNLIQDIFLDINKMFNTDYCRKFIALVKNFDFPLCKEKIISYLHNGNKACIKAFEHLTGLKLPKSYRKRTEYLKSISSSNFKGIQAYKVKTKLENKELFYISMFCGGWNGVMAEPFEKHGIDMFMFDNGEQWSLSESKSGMMIASAKNKEELFERFDELMKNETEETFKDMIAEKINEIWQKKGINPKYAV